MIINADAVQWAKDYEGELFHAFLADTPYELGFMGKDWDKSGVAFKVDTWAAFMRVLHPGAFGMAFASSRGWHRMAVAIEDAGFIIHPTIFGWANGAGFPKATRVKGSEVFSGHRYGLQCLKPAIEPIIVFQKKYEGKPVDCITRTGAGALWIDGGRIEAVGGITNGGNFTQSHADVSKDRSQKWGMKPLGRAPEHPLGRWAANFILLDPEAAAALDRQSGESKSPGTYTRNKDSGNKNAYQPGIGELAGKESLNYGDSGGASRFFYNVQQQLDDADPIKYQAKASRKERDAGLDGMDATITPTNAAGRNKCIKCGGWAYNAGSAINRPKSTCFCKEPEFEFIPSRQTPIRNVHPTVKPLDLTRYLATLLLPPALYAPRRIFVPFAGVASEMIGAMLAGWEDVTGVELTAEYIPIAEARIKHWTKPKDQPELL